MFRESHSGLVALVTIITIAAFVIVLLAFFFSSATRPGSMTGAPHAYTRTEVVSEQKVPGTTTAERPNVTPTGKDQQPAAVRENGLPQAGDLF